MNKFRDLTLSETEKTAMIDRLRNFFIYSPVTKQLTNAILYYQEEEEQLHPDVMFDHWLIKDESVDSYTEEAYDDIDFDGFKDNMNIYQDEEYDKKGFDEEWKDWKVMLYCENQKDMIKYLCAAIVHYEAKLVRDVWKENEIE